MHHKKNLIAFSHYQKKWDLPHYCSNLFKLYYSNISAAGEFNITSEIQGLTVFEMLSQVAAPRVFRPSRW